MNANWDENVLLSVGLMVFSVTEDASPDYC